MLLEEDKPEMRHRARLVGRGLTLCDELVSSDSCPTLSVVRVL